MSKPKGLTKPYMRYPTNEKTKNDFDSRLYVTWAAVHVLYEYLSACHRDGLLIGIARSPDRVLADLADVREWLGGKEGDFELDLDLSADTPAPAAAAH
jgi:hypothetical protein